jgi:hypothetical protein
VYTDRQHLENVRLEKTTLARMMTSSSPPANSIGNKNNAFVWKQPNKMTVKAVGKPNLHFAFPKNLGIPIHP